MNEERNAYHRQWRKENPEASRAASRRYRESAKGKTNRRALHLRRKYGLSLEQFDQMRESQGNCCALCREPFAEDIAVDHDHATGAVRGLLHRKCNAAIGGLNDDYHRIQMAALYLHSTHKGSIHPWARIGDPPEHRDWKPGMTTFYPEVDPTARLNSFVTVDSGMEKPTRVGARTFCMSKTHIGHDSQIGDDVELAAGTIIAGHVTIGDGARLGVNVCVKPRVTIGAGARIGAGAVVVKDVPAGETWIGCPARNILPDAKVDPLWIEWDASRSMNSNLRAIDLLPRP